MKRGAAVLAVLAALLAAGCTDTRARASDPAPPSPRASGAGIPGIRAAEDAPRMGRKVSIGEALSLVPTGTLVPDFGLLGQPDDVRLVETPEGPIIGIFLEDEVQFELAPYPYEGEDFETLADSLNEDATKYYTDGRDNAFEVVERRGLRLLVHERGVQMVDGEENPVDSSVEFRQGRVTCTISSPEQGVEDILVRVFDTLVER